MDAPTRERIEHFIAIAEKVKTSPFVQQTKKVGYQMNWVAGQPLKQEVTGFDEVALRSVLMDLRKVTMPRDGVYLPTICDLLIASTTNQETIANIKKCRENYDLAMKVPAVKMVINGKDEMGVVKKWLYGHYFHEEREQELRDLGVVQPMHKANFVVAVTELIAACAVVANNAKVILAAV